MPRGKRRPRPNEPLAGAIWDFVQKCGSHDKAAAELGTTRTTVNDWEKGVVPQEPFRSRLIEHGVSEKLWPARYPAERETLDSVRERLERIERDLADLAAAVRLLQPPEDH